MLHIQPSPMQIRCKRPPERMRITRQSSPLLQPIQHDLNTPTPHTPYIYIFINFIIGYIRDGNGGWLKAKHAPFVEEQLFEEVQRLRGKRTTNRGSIRSDASIYSLSGIARCVQCGNTLRSYKGKGRVRFICNGRLKGEDCTQPSTFLDIYEKQLTSYLTTFQIPQDYQEKILIAHRKLNYPNDLEKKIAILKTRLERIEELY